MCFWKKKKEQIGDVESWLLALGGKENIKFVEGKGSRLSFIFVDKLKLDKDKLTTLGVKSIIYMSEKTTLVLDKDCIKLATILSKKTK